MDYSARRILLAVDPRFLEGALATLLSARLDDEIVQLSQNPRPADGRYDVAVVSVQVPDGVHADVVITLPDTRGGAGVGTVRSGGVVHEVSISEAERLLELIEQHVPSPAGPQSMKIPL